MGSVGELINFSLLTICDHGSESQYQLIHDANDIPYYVPPREKNTIYEDMFVDESVFLPITMEDFKNDRKYYHFGFRYLVSSAGHSTLSLSSDPLSIGLSRMELNFDVNRVRFYVEKEKVIFDKTFDAIYPTRCIKIEAQTKDIGEQVAEQIKLVISQLNMWYLHRHV